MFSMVFVILLGEGSGYVLSGEVLWGEIWVSCPCPACRPVLTGPVRGEGKG